MIRRRHTSMQWRSVDADDVEEIGSSAQEILMLLQIASELEGWPARNMVYRKALDGVAHEIVQLAQRKSTELS